MRKKTNHLRAETRTANAEGVAGAKVLRQEHSRLFPETHRSVWLECDIHFFFFNTYKTLLKKNFHRMSLKKYFTRMIEDRSQ